MINTDAELAEIVCTRISHDLIGNIGALSGALELIKENSGGLDEDTLAIIETATLTLKARQKFFRLAFGTDNTSIDASELVQICEDYLKTVGSRNFPLTLKCKGVSSVLGKILCLCVMIAAEVCVKGGEISVTVNKENLQINVNSENKLSMPKINAYKQILSGQRVENISQYVQLVYLCNIIGKTASFNLDASENEMVLLIN